MKTLIIPTDFSSLSKKALDFAIGLADQIGGGIMPLHSYAIPHTSETFSVSLIDMLRKNAEENMEQFVADVPAHIPCQNKVTPYPLKHELQQLAHDDANIWVVMATRGIQDWWDHQLGTNASHVVNHMNAPLFLISEDAPARLPLKKVLVATDGLPMTEEVRMKWNSLKSELGFTSQALEVVNHLNEEGSGSYEDMPLYKLYHENFRDGLTEAEQIVTPDATLVIHHKRNWIDALFHKSATKELALRHPAPLIVLHE